MAMVDFRELMAEAARGNYAVGYFEPWGLESLVAVLRGAEAARSPVMVGWSGIFTPKMMDGDLKRFAVFAEAGRRLCERSGVPAAYLFNETPYWDWALASLEMGFNVVMYSNPTDGIDTHRERTKELVERALARGVAVEAETESLLVSEDEDRTHPLYAAKFVEATGVDALGGGGQSACGRGHV